MYKKILKFVLLISLLTMIGCTDTLSICRFSAFECASIYKQQNPNADVEIAVWKINSTLYHAQAVAYNNNKEIWLEYSDNYVLLKQTPDVEYEPCKYYSMEEFLTILTQ